MRFSIDELFSIYSPNTQVKLGPNTTKLFDQLPPPVEEKLDVAELRKLVADWDRDCAFSYPESISADSFVEEMIEDVAVSLYKAPNASAKTPTVLLIHGGGFFCELPNVHRSFMANIASRVSCHGVLPHYSLAPEAKAPKAIEEITSVLRTLLKDSSELIIVGYSSGGNLAWHAVLNILHAGDMKKFIHKISHLFLMSPWADVSMETTKQGPYQYQQNTDKMLQTWSLAQMRDYYLPQGTTGKELFYSPIYRKASELKAMPKTTIIVGEADCLLSDAIVSTQLFKEANVPVQLVILEGQIHNHSCHNGLRDGVFTPDIISAVMQGKPVDTLKGSDGLGLIVKKFN